MTGRTKSSTHRPPRPAQERLARERPASRRATASARPTRPAPDATPQRDIQHYLIATAVLWAGVLVLWLGGALRTAGSLVFLLALAAAAVFVVAAISSVAEPGDPVRTAQRGVLLVLAALLPVLFDTRTFDVFNVPRYTALVVAALGLVALAAVEAARRRQAPTWRNGLRWPVLGLLAWGAAATVASVNPRLSVLGAYQSYHGLWTALALAVVLFAFAHSFRPGHVKVVLSVLYFAGAGPVLVYGLVQLHDRRWGGSRWDWVDWGQAQTFSVGTAIWSTFGNPNHLAGFLAMMLPLGVVLALLHRQWWVRALVAAMSGAIVLELLQTTTRGAWMAALAALATLAVLLSSEIRRRPRATAAVVAALALAVAGSAAFLGSSADLTGQFGSAFDREDKTATQRVELWKTAMRVANDSPVVGTGPDTYPSVYPAYKSPKLVRLFGPEQSVNSPHNLFMDYLANHGYPGLAAFLALLAVGGLLALRAWLHLGRAVRHADVSEFERRAAQDTRVVLAALLAGLVAYLVQASFNTQQIGLTFVFWALLGLTCAVASGGRVPDALSPATRRSSQGDAGLPVVASVAALAFVVLGVMAAGPYRADLHFRSSMGHNEAAQAAGRSDPIRARELAVRSRGELEKAIDLNPWEPTYIGVLARSRFSSALRLPEGSPEHEAAVEEARGYYERAVRTAPRDPALLEGYANVLAHAYQDDPSDQDSRRAAIAVMRRAVRANPFQPDLTAALGRLLGS